MHHEEQHLFPALQITYILASTTLQHISLQLNGLRLSARIQIVTTSQVEIQILFMPKASRQKPTTQHTKDTGFFTCHLITGDISRARTAETYPQLHSYLCQKSGQAVGSFVPGESGREMKEEWACTAQFGIICNVEVNQQQSHKRGGGRSERNRICCQIHVSGLRTKRSRGK